ncbi:multisubunit sodium/hydrogen antiporter, MnhE subunit [Thermococcus onnurineus NA1]|uniref:Multisubunit sodium/hydrogen antiporter, MnhE subunit n=1 Tax=Thermococcus onnurineus (strain NA1) TaxID=523850 RepID=B6YXL0_THEON|nr:monovalent cation/H+ antiporter subunit E [Thermococcus onnurineus]ACJ16823.1 multisubunit sodium/hydrogen antiporter, MnhE subunit [Thermococcus onnurineus NA1]
MSRIPFYLKERLENLRERVLHERFEASKLPVWERIILTWAPLLAFWVVISANLEPRNLFLGATVTLIIASFMRDMLTEDIRRTGHVLEKLLYFTFLYLPQYLIIMAFRLIESNLKVAKNVIFLDIHPGIVKIKTDLHSDTGVTILANSITLTPGTLTLDVSKKLGETYLYVHWIDLETLNREKAGEKIKGDIEEWLKKVFW